MVVGIFKGAIKSAIVLIPWESIWQGLLDAAAEQAVQVPKTYADNLVELREASQDLVDSKTLPEATKALKGISEAIIGTKDEFSLFRQDPIISGFIAIADALNIDVLGALGNVVEGVGGLIDAFLGKGGEGQGGLSGALFTLGRKSKESSDALGLIDEVIGSAGSGVWGVVRAFGRDVRNSFAPLLGVELPEAVGQTLTSLKDVGGYIGDAFTKTWESITDFWRETALPLLEQLRDIIGGVAGKAGESLFSVTQSWQESIENLAGVLSGVFTNTLNVLNEQVLEPFVGVLQTIWDKVNNLIDRIKRLASIIPGISLPEDLVQESPSNFETSLQATMDLMGEMTSHSIPMLASALHGQLGEGMIPAFASGNRGINSVGAIPGGTSVDNSRSFTANLGGQTINSGMDAATFAALVERAMRNAV